MAGSIYSFATLLVFCFIIPFSFSEPVQEQPLVLKYHNGPLLKGKITVIIIWYGKFTPVQRSIILYFINSLSSAKSKLPSTLFWWKTTEKYWSGSPTLVVGKQILFENYPLSKILKNPHLPALAGKLNGVNTINIILTAKDVVVEGFCMSESKYLSNGRRKCAEWNSVQHLKEEDAVSALIWLTKLCYVDI